MDGNVAIKHVVVRPELSTILSFKLCPKQVLQARLINLKTTIAKEWACDSISNYSYNYTYSFSQEIIKKST